MGGRVVTAGLAPGVVRVRLTAGDLFDADVLTEIIAAHPAAELIEKSRPYPGGRVYLTVKITRLVPQEAPHA